MSTFATNDACRHRVRAPVPDARAATGPAPRPVLWTAFELAACRANPTVPKNLLRIKLGTPLTRRQRNWGKPFGVSLTTAFRLPPPYSVGGEICFPQTPFLNFLFCFHFEVPTRF